MNKPKNNQPKQLPKSLDNILNLKIDQAINKLPTNSKPQADSTTRNRNISRDTVVITDSHKSNQATGQVWTNNHAWGTNQTTSYTTRSMDYKSTDSNYQAILDTIRQSKINTDNYPPISSSSLPTPMPRSVMNGPDTNEKDLEKAIAESKRQSELDEKRRQDEQQQLIASYKTELENKLIKIINEGQCSNQKLLQLKLALTTYESKTSKTIFDTCNANDIQIRELADKSRLMLYVAKILANNKLNPAILFEWFESLVRQIENELADKLYLVLFDKVEHTKDLESEFKHAILAGSLVCVNIRGDGNCLWNCISTALYGNYSRMECLRVLTGATLIRHRDEFEAYMREQRDKYGYNHELTFEGLVEAAMDLQVWGDELHIMALSLALRRPIYSYGSLRSFRTATYQSYDKFRIAYEGEPVANHFRYLANESDDQAQPILLYYNGMDHYSVVLPERDGVVAPVPQMQLLEPIIKLPDHKIDKLIDLDYVDDHDESSLDKSGLSSNQDTQNSSSISSGLSSPYDKQAENSLQINSYHKSCDLLDNIDGHLMNNQVINEYKIKIQDLNDELVIVKTHNQLLTEKCVKLEQTLIQTEQDQSIYKDKLIEKYGEIALLKNQNSKLEQQLKLYANQSANYQGSYSAGWTPSVQGENGMLVQNGLATNRLYRNAGHPGTAHKGYSNGVENGHDQGDQKYQEPMEEETDI